MNSIILVPIFWLIFSIFPMSLLAQTFPVDVTTGKIYYAEEVLVKDGPQLDLYHRAKAWFSSVSKNKEVFKVDDLPNGVIIGNNYSVFSVLSGNQNQSYQLWYTLKIEMEDDRYWYSLTDFKLQKVVGSKSVASSGSKATQQPLEALVLPEKAKSSNKLLKEAAHKSILSLIDEIKKSMD